MLVKEFQASSISELSAVCLYLKQLSTQHLIISFSGQMGAGKTTLIQQFCHHLDIEDQVSSPTFSLVNEYRSATGPVYHFDLYRLRTEEELYDMGYEDYFYSGYLCLIEWPEMAPSIMPQDHVSVQIRIENEDRIITVTHP